MTETFHVQSIAIKTTNPPRFGNCEKCAWGVPLGTCECEQNGSNVGEGKPEVDPAVFGLNLEVALFGFHCRKGWAEASWKAVLRRYTIYTILLRQYTYGNLQCALSRWGCFSIEGHHGMCGAHGVICMQSLGALSCP